MQMLKPVESVDFNLDIEALHGASSEVVAHRLKEMAAEPFEQYNEKLFRFKLLKLDNDQHILFICIQHLIADGWSFGILYREISALYHSYYHETETSLPLLPIQYIDFSVWQRAIYEENTYQQQIMYWQKNLANLDSLAMPIDFARPVIQTYNGEAVYFKIPPKTIAVLRQFSQKHNITLFTTLLSAFGILLSRYTNQTDIAIGIPIANRNLQSIENIIGFFVNTLVIRLDLSAQLLIHQLLKKHW